MVVRELWGGKYGREMMRLSKLERGVREEERGRICGRITRKREEEEEEEEEGGWEEGQERRREEGRGWEEGEGVRGGRGKKDGRGGWEEGLVGRMYAEAETKISRLEKGKSKSILKAKKCGSFHSGFLSGRGGSEISTFLTDSEVSKIKEENEEDGGGRNGRRD